MEIRNNKVNHTYTLIRVLDEMEKLNETFLSPTFPAAGDKMLRVNEYSQFNSSQISIFINAFLTLSIWVLV